MKKNMGIVDRLVRLLIAVVILTLCFTGIVTGGVAIVLLVFAFIFTLTAFIRFCPLYVLFNINTCKVNDK